jgi:hypothetical protein
MPHGWDVHMRETPLVHLVLVDLKWLLVENLSDDTICSKLANYPSYRAIVVRRMLVGTFSGPVCRWSFLSWRKCMDRNREFLRVTHFAATWLFADTINGESMCAAMWSGCCRSSHVLAGCSTIGYELDTMWTCMYAGASNDELC